MSELIEIYDESRKKTDIIKTKKEVHTHGYLHKTIHVWILDNQNRILIQKRSASKSTHPLKWDVSCAGHISAGETAEQAAVKEIYEELGLEIKEEDLKKITTLERKHFIDQIKDYEFYDVFFIRMDFRLDDVKIDPEEVQEVDIMDAGEFFKEAEQNKDFLNNPREYSIMKNYIFPE